MRGFAKFLAMLAIWAASSTVLYYLSLLSVSIVIINVMVGVAAVCLVVALILFFMGRHSQAFLFAAGPFFTVVGLVAISVFLGTFLGMFL